MAGGVDHKEGTPVTDNTVPRPRRDTGRHRDGKVRGLYWRARADGSKEWSIYDPRRGRTVGGFRSRQAALDAQSKARLDKSAGLPAPDTRTLIRDLAEEVRQTKERRLRPSSFRAWEDALDRIVLPELGHLRPAQCVPDRLARLIRDLEAGKLTDGRKLSRDTIVKYLQPLSAILGLAVRRGIVPSSPMTLLSPDERPQANAKRRRFEWSPEAISKLIAAADALGQRSEARFNYAPLIQVLALTGLRIGEALALRWGDIDLLDGKLYVRQTLGRDGTLGDPKTAAGVRDVPLTPGLVDVLVRLKPEDATDEQFVFAGKRGRPVSYWNVRNRGLARAAELAGLEGVSVHDLRHAAASLHISSGLSAVDVAAVLGHNDASTTLKVYAHLFDRSDVDARIRAAQAQVAAFEVES
jgi:integrase